MSQGVPDSMLTPEEREWAFALEEALYGTDETTLRDGGRRGRRGFRRNRSIGGNSNNSNIKNKDMPSDFELATHAMIGKGNTARALKRIKRLAAFKETYRVPVFAGDETYDEETINNNHHQHESNTIEAVLLIVKKFLLAYPDFIRSIGMDKHGRVTVVFKLKGLRWSQAPPFNHTERDRFRALYCLMNALQPTIDSVRRGTIWIGDLKDVSEKPAPSFLEGCRKLLRDSFPIRVEDVPVVRCPPFWSAAFVGTYPYWSRHFGTKFVRVDPETLRKHFPSDLLAGAGAKNKKGGRNGTGTIQKRRRKIPSKKVLVAPNGDHYDNTWENLDDENDENNELFKLDDDDESNSEWSDWTTSVGGDGGSLALNGAETAIGKANVNNELWEKIERLVRMRFETERTFRVV